MSGKKIIYSPLAPEPIGPYSQAVKVGATLYVSGQIPIDTTSGKLISESVEKETDRVMKNLEAILTAARMDFGNVIKCTIFLKNMDDFATVNTVYGKYFREMPPARETVEVSELPKGVNIEISCIAVE